MLLTSTGNKAIDALQGLQLESDAYRDQQEREAFIVRQIGAIPLETLIDEYVCVVTKGNVYASSPELQQTNTRERFSDLAFRAPVAGVHYLKREEPSFKGIIVKFVFPTITKGVTPNKIKDCYDLTLVTPIFSIRSCMPAQPQALQNQDQC